MARLSIIRSSAGSGKTFTLTEEYLLLALRDPDSFRHMLAVTFTNKATAEMKSRLIKELYFLASGQESKHLVKFISSLQITEAELRRRAAVILQKILHQYSRFYVSTIDSFFQSIIRSFTREMGIQSGYSIELDTETVLEELIDRVEAETSKQKILLKWLTDLALDKIDRGKSWNFRNDLSKLGEQLFNERFKTFSHELNTKLADKLFLQSYQHELRDIQYRFESTLRLMASHGWDIIKKYGLGISDFSYGMSGPAGFIYKASRDKALEPTLRTRNAMGSASNWYTKSSPHFKAIEQLFHNGLKDALEAYITYHDQHSRDYQTARVVLKNLYALGILADLSLHLRDYCLENNTFILSEAASFLNRIIDDNDTPFIYEKSGYQFHHFMIDEFQDTSQLQWNNFKPLISNSLSQGYDNLIVGDVKQAIYRWRNSNWEILSSHVGKEFYEQSLSLRTLDRNFRSAVNITQFNNSLFERASFLLQEQFNSVLSETEFQLPEDLQDAIQRNYRDAFQELSEKSLTDGMIRINFLDRNGYRAQMKEQLILLLSDLLKKGYQAGDIAILTRKREEAKDITDFLLGLKNSDASNPLQPDVISEETLYISSSPAVRFLIGVIQYLHFPQDNINNCYIIHEFLTCLSPEGDLPGKAEMIQLLNCSDDTIGAVFPASFRQLQQNTGNYSLSELLENLIAVFGIDRMENESVYLQALQDLIMDFTQRKSTSLGDFLEYWKESGYKKSVSLPGNRNAIRVMTIHKAKGLEFPVVILPYCTWKTTETGIRSLIWCSPQTKPFNAMERVPVEFSSGLAHTHFVQEYYEELLKQYVDFINLLYVAFTRASHALFCYTEMAENKKLSGVPDLLYRLVAAGYDSKDQPSLISFSSHYNPENRTFEYGKLPLKSTPADYQEDAPAILNRYPVYDARHHFRIAFQGKTYLDPQTNKLVRPVSLGSMMHEIFSKILLPGDIEPALTSMAMEGKLNPTEKEELLTTIRSKFKDARVASWFSSEWRILTETEFILPGGKLRRPDRVLIKDDRAVVVDLKFGQEILPEHRKQVLEYSFILSDMGYRHTEAWLWYVMLNQVMRVNKEDNLKS